MLCWEAEFKRGEEGEALSLQLSDYVAPRMRRASIFVVTRMLTDWLGDGTQYIDHDLHCREICIKPI